MGDDRKAVPQQTDKAARGSAPRILGDRNRAPGHDEGSQGHQINQNPISHLHRPALDKGNAKGVAQQQHGIGRKQRSEIGRGERDIGTDGPGQSGDINLFTDLQPPETLGEIQVVNGDVFLLIEKDIPLVFVHAKMKVDFLVLCHQRQNVLQIGEAAAAF